MSKIRADYFDFRFLRSPPSLKKLWVPCSAPHTQFQ